MLDRRLRAPRPWPSMLRLLLIATATVGQAGADSGPILFPEERDALPIGMTAQEWEMRHLIGVNHQATSPAVGPIRQCAEWEPVTGALVRYQFGLPVSLMAEISEDLDLWVYVASASQQTAASTALSSGGANMANVHFIVIGTNSIWTRDYGPQFIFDGNGDAGIVDHIYNRPRPLDDVTNYEAGDQWATPVYGSEIIHTGGNFMGDGHGIGYSTDLVYDENPELTPAGVDQQMLDYLGVSDYRVVDDISIGGIHHIDVWAKLLDEERVLVKQVPSGNVDFARCEARAAELAAMTNCYGEPLQVERIFCASIGGGQVAAYTNAIILNDKVFVPTFGIAQDAIALQTFEDLMPGYEVLGYAGTWVSDDAIHCRAMGIHDKHMLYVDTNPLPETTQESGPIRVDALVRDYSEAGLVAGWPRVYWRLEGGGSFSPITMLPDGGDDYYAEIPAPGAGATVEYYVQAMDNSGRTWQRPPVAPGDVYSFTVELGPADVADGAAVAALEVSSQPNPFQTFTTVTFRLPAAGRASVRVFDVSGRQVAELADQEFTAGPHTTLWDGRDAAGRQVANGVYLVRLDAGARTVAGRILRID